MMALEKGTIAAEKPLATCGDCGARFRFEGTELDAEICDPCAEALSDLNEEQGARRAQAIYLENATVGQRLAKVSHDFIDADLIAQLADTESEREAHAKRRDRLAAERDELLGKLKQNREELAALGY